MKTPARHLLAAVVFTAAASLFAASKPQPNFRPLAVELVSTYLDETKDENDETWGKFAADKKIGDQQLAQTCREALETARAIVAAGTPVDSPFFARVLADSFGLKLTASSSTPAVARTAPAETGKGSGAAPAASPGKPSMSETQKVVAPLREYGFAFSFGAGTSIDGSKSALMQSLFVRYNLRQDYATKLWNQKQSSHRAGSETEMKTADTPLKFSGNSSGLLDSNGAVIAPTGMIQNLTHKLTFSGPVIGRALDGEKINMGGRDVRPWLLGWGLGFGLGPEGSSALYVDLCATASPYSGFAHAKPYVGVSFDGTVALKLFKFIGEPFGYDD